MGSGSVGSDVAAATVTVVTGVANQVAPSLKDTRMVYTRSVVSVFAGKAIVLLTFVVDSKVYTLVWYKALPALLRNAANRTSDGIRLIPVTVRVLAPPVSIWVPGFAIILLADGIVRFTVFVVTGVSNQVIPSSIDTFIVYSRSFKVVFTGKVIALVTLVAVPVKNTAVSYNAGPVLL
jgi:hypothetical protein